MTAPTPVTTPQPISAASSDGNAESTATHDCFLAEGRGAERGEQRGAVGRGRVRLRERVVEAVLAELGMPVETLEAAAARRDPREHDVVIGCDGRHRVADRDDDARALMAEH